MTDDANPEEKSSHLGRWVMLFALAVVAAVVGRQVAVNSADREFEARLARLDAERDRA
ncbi:MAG: hypothetical protein R2716_12305 [Microthrixaceae bacterium]